MLSQAWSMLTGLFLAMCLLSLCLVRCDWQPDVTPQKTAVSWLKPGATEPVHDTVATTRIVEKVVVQKLYVPRVDTVRDTVRVEVPRYYVQTKCITVAAKADNKGLTIDSLRFDNTKSITASHDKKGNVVVDVRNSNPYFSSADVKRFTYHVPVYPRLTWGLQGGIYVTPAGVQPGVGIGVNFALSRRR